MAFFYFASWQDAILVLLIFLSLALELFNSALENICDMSGTVFNHHKKRAKDFAAASVLLISFAAAFIFAIFVSENPQNFNYIPLTGAFIAIASISIGTGLIASLIKPSKASLSLIIIFCINHVVLSFIASRPQWLVLSFFMSFLWIFADIRKKSFTKDPMA